jgi:hypothetical protein
MSTLVFSRIFCAFSSSLVPLLSFLGSSHLFSVVFFLLHLLLCGHHLLVWMDQPERWRPTLRNDLGDFRKRLVYLWMMLPLRTRFWRDEYGCGIESDRIGRNSRKKERTTPTHADWGAFLMPQAQAQIFSTFLPSGHCVPDKRWTFFHGLIGWKVLRADGSSAVLLFRRLFRFRVRVRFPVAALDSVRFFFGLVFAFLTDASFR